MDVAKLEEERELKAAKLKINELQLKLGKVPLVAQQVFSKNSDVLLFVHYSRTSSTTFSRRSLAILGRGRNRLRLPRSFTTFNSSQG